MQQLDGAVAIFEANGLDAPTSFRAGAWMAEENLLQALSETGFVAESSALNTDLLADDGWPDLEETLGEEYNDLLWEWNTEHWSEVDATSQPYHPSASDAQLPGDPAVLEVPDNGALADYLSTDDMQAVLDANWGGGSLEEPLAFSIGYHNLTHGIGFDYRTGIEEILDILDEHLSTDDAGPVVNITLGETARVWP